MRQVTISLERSLDKETTQTPTKRLAREIVDGDATDDPEQSVSWSVPKTARISQDACNHYGSLVVINTHAISEVMTKCSEHWSKHELDNTNLL